MESIINLNLQSLTLFWVLGFGVFSRLCCERGTCRQGGGEMGLTCHYSSNEDAHVGTERAGPEQAQGTVRFPAIGATKIKL